MAGGVEEEEVEGLLGGELWCCWAYPSRDSVQRSALVLALGGVLRVVVVVVERFRVVAR